jgi:acetyl-CoA carboxylase biotin carboxyl carrier protein
MNVDELERLAVLVQQANIRELTLREGESRITIRKGAQAHGTASLPYAPARVAEDADTETALVLHDADGADAQERVVFITSPLVGVFHHVNPVVGLGAPVKEGQTIGVIESMNLVHEVGATEYGVVTDVLIEDGVVVEYGQRLFALQADTTE